MNGLYFSTHNKFGKWRDQCIAQGLIQWSQVLYEPRDTSKCSIFHAHNLGGGLSDIYIVLSGRLADSST